MADVHPQPRALPPGIDPLALAQEWADERTLPRGVDPLTYATQNWNDGTYFLTSKCFIICLK